MVASRRAVPICSDGFRQEALGVVRLMPGRRVLRRTRRESGMGAYWSVVFLGVLISTLRPRLGVEIGPHAHIIGCSHQAASRLSFVLARHRPAAMLLLYVWNEIPRTLYREARVSSVRTDPSTPHEKGRLLPTFQSCSRFGTDGLLAIEP